MTGSDLDFYRRRLIEEEARAAESPCPSTRAAHVRLAQLYRRKLQAAEAGADDETSPTPLQPVI